MTALGTVLPWWGGQFFDNNGDPLNAGKVYFYLAGTSTKTDTWSDSDLITENTNPVVLDSNGRATIFLDPTVTYKVVVATSTAADPPVGAEIIRTLDGVSTALDPSATKVDILAGETITEGQWIYCSQGEGGTTAGRWYLTDANLEYASVRAKQVAVCLEASLSAGETGAALLSGLYTSTGAGYTVGSQYYLGETAGTIRVTQLENPRAVALALTTDTLLLSFWQVGGTTPRFTPGLGTDAAITSGVIEVNYETVTSSAVVPLWAYSVPANTLNLDGKGLRITIWGTTAGNANNKRVILDGSGDTIGGSPNAALAYNAVEWKNDIVVFRTGATAGIAVGVFAAALNTGAYAVEGPNQVRTVVTHDWTTAFVLTLTGTYVTNGDITKTGAFVEVIG